MDLELQAAPIDELRCPSSSSSGGGRAAGAVCVRPGVWARHRLGDRRRAGVQAGAVRGCGLFEGLWALAHAAAAPGCCCCCTAAPVARVRIHMRMHMRRQTRADCVCACARAHACMRSLVRLCVCMPRRVRMCMHGVQIVFWVNRMVTDLAGTIGVVACYSSSYLLQLHYTPQMVP